jgi:chromate transporter
VIDPVNYFWIFLKAAALSTGGLGNLPSLSQDLLTRHWATEADFGAALAVGQVTPGPTGLWIASLGYLSYGWLGVLLAVAASLLPPLLVIPVAGVHARYGRLPAIRDFTRGLSVAVVAVFPIVMLRLVGAGGFDWRSLLILAAAFALAVTRRVPQAGLLALAAGGGILLFR